MSLMSNENELALRRRRECGQCNKAGTKFCNSANTCTCWSDYGGAYCQTCTSDYSFISANGTCLPCPCDIHRSTGACFFDSTADHVVCVRCVPGFAGLRCDRSDNSTAVSAVNPNGGIIAPAAATPIIVASVSGALLLLVLLLLLAVYLARKRQPPRRDPPRIEVNPNDVFFSIADYTELSPPERKRGLPVAVKRNSAQFYFLSPNGGDEVKLMDDSDDEQQTGAAGAEPRC